MGSTLVEPTRSRRRTVTIEEEEDEDIQQMNAKTKLNHDSTYIIESDDDEEHVVFDRIESKEKRKSKTPKSSNINPPVQTGRKFECPKAPNIRESSVPALHSNT